MCVSSRFVSDGSEYLAIDQIDSANEVGIIILLSVTDFFDKKVLI